MRCAVLGEGREVLHECDKWSEAVDWLRRYTDDGCGGWAWFTLTLDGAVRATFMEVSDAAE